MKNLFCFFALLLSFSPSAQAVYKLEGSRAQQLFSALAHSGAAVVNSGPHQRLSLDTLQCLSGRNVSGVPFHSCTFNSGGRRCRAPTEALAIDIEAQVNAAGLASVPHGSGLLLLRASSVECQKLATTTPGRFNWACGINR